MRNILILIMFFACSFVHGEERHKFVNYIIEYKTAMPVVIGAVDEKSFRESRAALSDVVSEGENEQSMEVALDIYHKFFKKFEDYPSLKFATKEEIKEFIERNKDGDGKSLLLKNGIVFFYLYFPDGNIIMIGIDEE